ncbi:MAG: hypothetical protein CR993_02810 [Rhodobacterales bacterium]|nr:MAG: hypothetical protein CR993_02810 [Rhodobacterales bacterium]
MTRHSPFAADGWAPQPTGLPDPDTQSEFYADTAVKRLFAWLVDGFVIFLISLTLALLTFGLGFFVFAPLSLAVSFLYRSVSIANRSATPGMRLMAIELRNHRGERLDAPTAMFHTAGHLASMAFTPLQLISIVLMLTNARGQSLIDMLLGTAMINRAANS